MSPRTLVIGGVLALCVLVLPFFTVFDYLELNEIAVTWNPIRGETGIQDHAGWHVHTPWTLVSKIDTRPQRVCLTSSAHAAVNCRLVQFVPSAYKAFIATEGFRYYWWSNRLSFNSGYREEYRGMRDVLRGYAFGAQQYPFVKVLKEY